MIDVEMIMWVYGHIVQLSIEESINIRYRTGLTSSNVYDCLIKMDHHYSWAAKLVVL